MRVLGLDPGSQRCGYGVLDRDVSARPIYVECGVLNLLSADTLNGRLSLLWADIGDLLEEHRPDVVAIETAFVDKFPRSALVLGEVRGLAKAAAFTRAIEIVEYAPAHVKKVVTGRGGATKPDVRTAVIQALGLEGLPPLDASDAVAVALCCLTTRKTSDRAHPRANRSGTK